jgi:hypothetical protein
VFFIIVDGVILLIFETSKAPVVEPFAIASIKSLTLGEDFPQGAAIELEDRIAKKARMSHFIIESMNMGLLLKYILERNY